MSILLYFYVLLYCPFIIYYYTKLIKKFENPKYVQNVPEKYKPFTRYDVSNWNKVEIYFCALFLLPIRLLGVIVSSLIFYVILSIASEINGVKQPWNPFFKRVSPLLKFFARAYIFFSGFHYINKRIVKYSDFDPDYEQAESDRTRSPSIIVSNHITWYDTFIYVFTLLPSFLSKSTIANYPIFGPITTNLKSIYVSRESEISRKKAEHDIQERVDLVNKGYNYPPLIIFPEGTVSNGRYLLSFKRGAFERLEPVKIYLLKYNDRHFNMTMCSTGLIAVTFLAMVQLTNKLEILEFEGVYNPKHLKLEQYPQEKRWEIYAEKVKDIMSQCLGVQKSNSGYRENEEYERDYLGTKKKG